MAYEFYVTVEGTKNGMFSEEIALGAHQGKLAGLAFNFSIVPPRDAATGQASGRRANHSVSFVKEWGAATPQFVEAVIGRKVLKSVLFEFVKINETGEEYYFHTIELTNASVSAIEQYIELDDEKPPATRPLEKISLTFQKFEMENTDVMTTASGEGSGR